MAAANGKMTAAKVESLARTAGRHSVGEGLYLTATKAGSASWAFRFRLNKKVHEMGLGSFPDVGLKEARAAVADGRKLLARKINPLTARKEARAIPTFGDCADEYVARQSKSVKSATTRARLKNCLENHAKPLRGLPVNEIGVSDVLRVLEPVWDSKPETATKLRAYIEGVLDLAAVDGHRDDGRNPAAWRGVLRNKLSKPKKLTRGHHRAMPIDDMPAFMAELRAKMSVSARALEFLALTAVRTGELRLATWAEFDLNAKVWVIPAERMKANEEHRVPLSERAVAILSEMEGLRTTTSPTAFAFPGTGKKGHLSENALLSLMQKHMKRDATPHGLRSTFRDWAGDRTAFPRELAEQALAHSVGSAVERAYRRSDALAKRRKLMDAWASFCVSDPGANVVQLHAGAART